jgi:hypothetical protein
MACFLMRFLLFLFSYIYGWIVFKCRQTLIRDPAVYCRTEARHAPGWRPLESAASTFRNAREREFSGMLNPLARCQAWPLTVITYSAS